MRPEGGGGVYWLSWCCLIGTPIIGLSFIWDAAYSARQMHAVMYSNNTVVWNIGVDVKHINSRSRVDRWQQLDVKRYAIKVNFIIASESRLVREFSYTRWNWRFQRRKEANVAGRYRDIEHARRLFIETIELARQWLNAVRPIALINLRMMCAA